MKAKIVHSAILAVGVCATANAQVCWLPRTGAPVGARYGHFMAYDSQRGRTVLFGGWGNSVELGDTWEWNGLDWASVATTGPSPRFWGAMAFDSQRGRTVLFGGYSNPGTATFYGDTWEWNGQSWSQAAATGPAGRTGHAMVFDSLRNRVIMFGGHVGNAVFVGDTWQWDGSVWQQLSSTGPAARESHKMAYDSLRDRVVLFGGYTTGTVYVQHGDTWEWNGTSWTQVAASGPSTREAHALAFDDQRGRTVLFGGWHWIPPYGVMLADTWEWSGTVWTQLPTAPLSARQSPGMAFDSQRGRMVMFGGGDTMNVFSDAWELTPHQYLGVAYGVGCGSPPLSLQQVPTSFPLIGATAQAQVSDVPSTVAVVSVGWNRTSFGPWQIPFSLTGFGMPGCNLLHSTDVFGLGVAFTSPSTAIYSLGIPSNMALVGQHFYLQAFAVAPLANPQQLIISNGLDWQIGY